MNKYLLPQIAAGGVVGLVFKMFNPAGQTTPVATTNLPTNPQIKPL